MEEKDEIFDKLKGKVLKYILYKKRTEKEVLQKFANEDENLLSQAIEYLKDAGYINDNEYVEKAINEFTKLKNLSIKEIEYKLMTKGLKKDLISDYIYKHKEELVDYELQSAKNIINKKKQMNELDEIKAYLAKKGYMNEIIKVAIEESYE